jgi:putative Holliday junction resolvase
MRILAVDHGQKHIGLAISDETATLARPLMIVPHVSKVVDAALVAERAAAEDVGMIIVGASYTEDGDLNPAGRRAANFAEILRQQTEKPVILWDESLTTQDARALSLELGRSRKQRGGHQDALAASILLQSYLDSLTPPNLD